MRSFFVFALFATVLAVPAFADVTVLNFEDLPDDQILTNTDYAGLTWETGNTGWSGNQGQWMCPTNENNFPSSGSKNLINTWGCTQIGIGFPEEVDVLGAYFASQGASYVWTSGVRVHGYRDGVLVETTDWFTDIDPTPDWFAISLFDVDRIVIESIPVENNAGWYGMDDFVFAGPSIPEPASLCLLSIGVLAIVRRRS